MIQIARYYYNDSHVTCNYFYNAYVVVAADTDDIMMMIKIITIESIYEAHSKLS